MYAARCAFPLINKPISSLASQISRWSIEADRRLHRIYEFLVNAADTVLTGSLALEDLSCVKLCGYADSDLAGDTWTTKSTTGYWVELQGAGGRTFPLAWASRFQGSTSTHTCESETVALCDALKREVVPLQLLLSKLLKREIDTEVFEDNAACMISVHKGYSPSMRYIGRTQKCSLGFLTDTCEVEPQAGGDLRKKTEKPVFLRKVETDKKKADLFTKDMDRMRFSQLSAMIGMVTKQNNKAMIVALSLIHISEPTRPY